jgi:hypothetical protein
MCCVRYDDQSLLCLLILPKSASQINPRSAKFNMYYFFNQVLLNSHSINERETRKSALKISRY